MLQVLTRLVQWLGFGRGPMPPGSERDPYARRPAPVRPRRPLRSDAVAVAEPDE
jgi:hypothetical protein